MPATRYLKIILTYPFEKTKLLYLDAGIIEWFSRFKSCHGKQAENNAGNDRGTPGNVEYSIFVMHRSYRSYQTL